MLSRQIEVSKNADHSHDQLRGELLESNKGIQNLLNGDVAAHKVQVEHLQSENAELRGHLHASKSKLELSSQEQISLQKENSRLRSELSDSRSGLKDAEGSKTAAKVQMLISEDKAASAQLEVDRLNDRIARLEVSSRHPYEYLADTDRLASARAAHPPPMSILMKRFVPAFHDTHAAVMLTDIKCKKLLARSLQELALETQHLLDEQRGLHMNETHELKKQLSSLQQAMGEMRRSEITISSGSAQQTQESGPRPTSPASSELSSVHSGGLDAAEIGNVLRQATSPSFLEDLSQFSSIAPITPGGVLKSAFPPNSSSKRAKIQSQDSVGASMMCSSRSGTIPAEQQTLNSAPLDLNDEDDTQILVPASDERSHSQAPGRFTRMHTRSPRSTGGATTSPSSPVKRKQPSKEASQGSGRPHKAPKRLTSGTSVVVPASKTGLRSEGRIIKSVTSQQTLPKQRRASGKVATTPQAKKRGQSRAACVFT